MDPVLIDHLKSGKAWVLVGSGPSNEMGYPSWASLATVAAQTVRVERPGHDRRPLEKALKRKDYPQVFQQVEDILGVSRLLQVLRDNLVPTKPTGIYKMIAEWPVPVYLTTNYEDEIQTHLARAAATFITYSNSEADMSLLSPGTSGIIAQLHGTLRSEDGLILTTSQYREIDQGREWEYWRTKMISIFQMTKVIVVGHSLSDNNIRHLLAAAKKGAAVDNPICWIAPDVPQEKVKYYLEKFRIRVIPYDNRDGSHRNLLRLIENVSQFVPPRATVRIKENVARIASSPLGENAAAPGFYVFNKLAGLENFDQIRADIILAALQSAIPALSALGRFSLQDAFELSGWPQDEPIPLEFKDQVESRALTEGIIASVGELFEVGKKASALAEENRKRFEHMSELFKRSLELRARRKFSQLTAAEAKTISLDIEASLTGYFREGGLSLTTTLFSDSRKPDQHAVPSSIVKFINESSAKYGSLLMRQAFSTVSVDMFVESEAAERDYLGRICQGFFAYHSLGVFGDTAVKRMQGAKDTVWLVDSNAQIPALALAAPTHALFADSLSRLSKAGIRFFTTDKLFRETFSHLGFATAQIATFGSDSSEIIAAATGDAPYRKSNQFLQGFINWRALGDSSDWYSYLHEIFGKRHPTYDDAVDAVERLGIEVVSFDVWPGFDPNDLREAQSLTEKIIDIWKGKTAEVLTEPEADDLSMEDLEPEFDPQKKAIPEAEALVIAKHERAGGYHILSNGNDSSEAWFVSDTSYLNIADPELGRVTWPTIGFLRFASTLAGSVDQKSADRAFQTLLLNCAQAGLNILSEDTINTVLGSRIDQDTIEFSEQLEIYKDIIEEKYGGSPQEVLGRVSRINRSLAAVQLANESAQKTQERLTAAEALAQTATKRALDAEKRLIKLEKFEQKMLSKKEKGKRIARKQKAKKARKKKKRR